MTMRTKIVVALTALFLLGVIVFLIVWMRAPSSVPDQAALDQPRKAPSAQELVAYETGGSIPSSEDVSATTHIVVTWATWCRLCTDVLRDLERIHVERGGGLPVLAINRAEPDPIARAYLTQEFPDSPLSFVADTDDRYFKEVEGYAMPELLIVSPDGDILYHHRGPITYDELQAQLESLAI